MGLYKRSGSAKWWCRFEVAGQEIKRSTRTADRRAAEVEERRLRSYFEARAPSRRAAGSIGLADLGGLDVERAVAARATPEHQRALEWQWGKIVDHFGADAEPRAITFETVQRYIAARVSSGAGDTVRREVEALKRAVSIAHDRGWLPFKPDKWPKLRRAPRSAKRRGRLHPPRILGEWLRELPRDACHEAVVVLLTGLRSAEAKRITAEWIEPPPDGITGVRAVLRIPAESEKRRHGRVVGLPDLALWVLRERIDELPPGSPPGLPLLAQSSHKTAYKSARKRIGYTTPISLRDLRHTWGTLANKLVGIDAARDGLGHAELGTTSRYVSQDLARVAAASNAVAGLLTRHSEVGTGVGGEAEVPDFMERAKGLEPSTLSLGSQLPAVLDHVATCRSCAERVLSCSKLTLIDVDPGTGESAQVGALPGRRA